MLNVKERQRGFGVLILVLAVAAFPMAYGTLFVPPACASGAPVFEDSFAVSSIWNGQDWNIYVKGSDPDGDMDYIWAVVTQAGGNSSDYIIHLKGDERKAFAGYITFPMSHWFSKRSWEYLKVRLKIKDRNGLYSEPIFHEVQIGSPTRESLPQHWTQVADHRLGTIFFDFEGQPGEGNDRAHGR